jgi:hypothetical protein
MSAVQRALHRAIPLHNTASRGCCAALTLLSALGLCLCAVATHQQLAWRGYAWAGYAGLLIGGCTILHCLRPTDLSQQPVPVQQPAVTANGEGSWVPLGYDEDAYQRDCALIGQPRPSQDTREWDTANERVRDRQLRAYCEQVLKGDPEASYPYATQRAPLSPAKLDQGNTLEQLQGLFEDPPLELLCRHFKAGCLQVPAGELMYRIEHALEHQRTVFLLAGRHYNPSGNPTTYWANALPHDCFLPINLIERRAFSGPSDIALLISRHHGWYEWIPLGAYPDIVVICPPNPVAPPAPPAPNPPATQ